MRIEEYLDAYERYRDTVYSMGKNARLMASKMESTADPRSLGAVGEIIEFVDYDELMREYERKKRILGRATARLQRAISRVHDLRYSSYLTARYLYGMKNEEIAANFNYCDRQIYRIAKAARHKLEEKLLLEMPKARRTLRKEYRRAPSPGARRCHRRHSRRRA